MHGPGPEYNAWAQTVEPRLKDGWGRRMTQITDLDGLQKMPHVMRSDLQTCTSYAAYILSAPVSLHSSALRALKCRMLSAHAAARGRSAPGIAGACRLTGCQRQESYLILWPVMPTHQVVLGCEFSAGNS